MRHFVCIVLFALLPVVSLLARQEGRPVLGLSCTADKPSYTVGDSVHLTITLENRGSSEFYVYRTLEWGWAGIGFTLTDATGHTVPARKPSIPLPPLPIYDKSQLVGLDPGYFYGTYLFFDLSHYDLKAGLYYLQVSYQSNYSGRSFGLPLLTFADGKFQSNKVQIEIRPK